MGCSVHFRPNQKKGGPKVSFREFRQYTFGDSWSGAVIEGKGQPISESRATINEVGVDF
jgi:hypothetical protein